MLCFDNKQEATLNSIDKKKTVQISFERSFEINNR